jgi:hypothetical protein
MPYQYKRLFQSSISLLISHPLITIVNPFKVIHPSSINRAQHILNPQVINHRTPQSTTPVQTDSMSNNGVQPIETSHYTYDANKPSTTTNGKQDTTHHSSSASTAQPTASKVHPVVDKPIEHPHAAPTTATSPVVASPTQHPHAAEHPHATAAAERPHPVGEHAQPTVVQHPAHPTTAAVVPAKDQDISKAAAVDYPQAAASHPQAAATPATTTSHPHVAFEQQPIIVAIIEDEDQMELQPHPRHHHNRSHNHHSQYDEGEQPHHKHDYNESTHPPHSAAHHAPPTPVSTNANDAPVLSNSALTESPQPDVSYVGGVEKKQPPHHSTNANNALVPSNNGTLTEQPPASYVGSAEQQKQTPHTQHAAAAAAAHPSTSISTTTPHPTTHHNTNANDALIPSDSILADSPTTSGGSYTSGNAERRHSWSKDELKRGAMEGLLETEGKKKVAKGGYSSTGGGY